MPLIIEQVNEPFGSNVPLSPSPISPPSRSIRLFVPILIALSAVGSLALLLSWWFRWRRMQAVRYAASPLALAVGVPVLSSASVIEPGVFGVFRQVLLLPNGIDVSPLL